MHQTWGRAVGTAVGVHRCTRTPVSCKMANTELWTLSPQRV